MKVVFYDEGADLYVTQQQGGNLKRAIAAGLDWIEINGSMYATKSIKKIMADGTVDIDTPRLAPPTTEISEEQRLKNIERIRQMKQDFLEGRRNAKT